ncbi:uncharacterized protein LOC144597540 [Rhinoraja longicauda]
MSHPTPSVVQDLFHDLRDGHQLLDLLEVLSGHQLVHERDRRDPAHWRSNVGTALRFLDTQLVKLVNINVPDVVEGNPTVVLGLVWSIILHFQMERLTLGLPRDTCERHLVPDVTPSPTGTPPLKRGRFQGQGRGSARQTLLHWAQDKARGTPVVIRDFGVSWQDGRAFAALVNSLHPGVLHPTQLQHSSPTHTLNTIFTTAENILGIPRLLEPHDLAVEDPDEKSIMTYVSQFLSLSGQLPAGVQVTEAGVFGDVEQAVVTGPWGESGPVSRVSDGCGVREEPALTTAWEAAAPVAEEPLWMVEYWEQRRTGPAEGSGGPMWDVTSLSPEPSARGKGADVREQGAGTVILGPPTPAGIRPAGTGTPGALEDLTSQSGEDATMTKPSQGHHPALGEHQGVRDRHVPCGSAELPAPGDTPFLSGDWDGQRVPSPVSSHWRELLPSVRAAPEQMSQSGRCPGQEMVLLPPAGEDGAGTAGVSTEGQRAGGQDEDIATITAGGSWQEVGETAALAVGQARRADQIARVDPVHQLFHLLPVSQFMVVPDKAHHCCVIRELHDVDQIHGQEQQIWSFHEKAVMESAARGDLEQMKHHWRQLVSDQLDQGGDMAQGPETTLGSQGGQTTLGVRGSSTCSFLWSGFPLRPLASDSGFELLLCFHPDSWIGIPAPGTGSLPLGLDHWKQNLFDIKEMCGTHRMASRHATAEAHRLETTA